MQISKLLNQVVGSLLLFECLCVNYVVAQDLSTFKNISPRELFERSWQSESRTEKVIIRSYLAKHYPNTAEGLFVKAWVYGYEDNPVNELKTYKECMEKYPDFLAAFINYAFSTDSTNEKIDYYNYVISKNPTFGSSTIRNLYLAYEEASKADSVLNSLEESLGIPNYFIFDFVRGIKYQSSMT